MVDPQEERFNGTILDPKVNAVAWRLRDDFKPDPSVPVFATIQGFKGLDAKVVILCDVEALRRETFSQYIYLAGTRARTLLYIVGTKDFWEEHQVE